jgi:5-methylthioribose kinase
MPLRRDAMEAHPAFPWLDADDAAGVRRFLAARGWLAAGEQMVACTRAGEGNMNLTLRVRTDRRSMILKQARPWVEKYDHIGAPWERSLSERWFYERVASIPEVVGHIPRLLASDAGARALLLEDLPGARDLTGLYAGERLELEEADELAHVLRALHDGTAADPAQPSFNRAMRELNHAHCFVVPLDPANVLPLDRFEPGLGALRTGLANDVAFRDMADEMGERYRSVPGPLVHGDYFPGSWLRTVAGMRVIDPEFCFRGEREIDVGCAVAHLVLARQAPSVARRFLDAYGTDAGVCDPVAIARYAAMEIVRRLIGVAQLPIAPTRGWRGALLGRAREAALGGSLAPLWAPA